MKQILKSLMSSMIIYTLVLAPVAGYAQDQAEGKVYEQGEEFSRDLDVEQMTTSGDAQKGVVKIIEQYISLMFAMAMLDATGWNYTSRSMVDCPSNKAASATMVIAQMGALALIIGEVMANMKFRKASKKAADKIFTAKTGNEEKDNKQIEAFEKLIEIYKGQESGMQTKMALSAVAAAAYAASGIIEFSSMTANVAICSASYATGVAREGAISTLLIQSLAAAKTQAVVPVGPTFPFAAPCGSLIAVASEYELNRTATLARLQTSATANVAYSTAKTTTATAMAISLWASIISFFTGGPDPKPLTKAIVMTSKTSMATDKAKSASILLDRTTIELTNTTYDTTVGSASGPCPGAIPSITAAVNLSALSRVTPLYCCGSDLGLPVEDAAVSFIGIADLAIDGVANAVGVNSIYTKLAGQIGVPKVPISSGQAIFPQIFNTPIPVAPGLMPYKTDITYGPVGAVTSIEKGMLFKSKFVDELIFSALYEIAEDQIFSKLDGEDPVADLKVINSTSQFIETMMINQSYKIKNNINLKKKLAEILKEGKTPINPQNAFARVGGIVSQVISEMDLISDAHAGGGIFTELMNLGIKLIVVKMVLTDLVKSWGLVKPYNRIWTWGIASAVTTILVSFQAKAAGDISKRRQIVEDELQRYKDSAVLKTKVEGEKDSAKRAEDYTLDLAAIDFNQREGSLSCAQKGGNGIDATTCPTVSKLPVFKLPQVGNRIASKAGKKTMTSINAIESVVGKFASGRTIDPKTGKSLVEADMALIHANRKGLTKKFNALVKKNDKGNKKRGLPSISESIASVAKQFSTSGTPFNAGKIPEGKKFDSDALAAINTKLEKANKKPLPKFEKVKSLGSTLQIPQTGGSSFDLFGDNAKVNVEETAPEKSAENFDEFVMNEASVNERSDQNIFKMISQRYVMSYKVLLKKKKKKSIEKVDK